MKKLLLTLITTMLLTNTLFAEQPTNLKQDQIKQVTLTIEALANSESAEVTNSNFKFDKNNESFINIIFVKKNEKKFLLCEEDIKFILDQKTNKIFIRKRSLFYFDTFYVGHKNESCKVITKKYYEYFVKRSQK